MVYFYLFSINKVSDIYINNTKQTILDSKKIFLKDTVNNMISDIDIERKAKAEYMSRLVSHTSSIINLRSKVEDENFRDFFISFFRNSSEYGLEYNLWTVILWDNKENKVIYHSKNIAADSWNSALNNIKSDLAYYRIVTHGNESAVFGVSKKYLDDLVKSEISNKIRNLKFEGNSYIWVNEIINYQGGRNYAIRRVHPNLPKTEGTYLSTDMTDIKGNYPYLTELQGINKNGELFFTYYFKELNSEIISEKLTYAKLYKDFNWVLDMGIYMNDIQYYIDQTNKESKALASGNMMILVFLFMIIMFFCYTLIMLIEKINQRNAKKILESEVNIDTLTNAESRRCGTKDLIRAFKEFQNNGSNAGVMLFDVDYFKNINDAYGHAVGDLTLKEIVNAVQHFIRKSDKLIRWGGDEFIVIFYGLQKENALGFGEKILSIASSLKIPVKNEEISATLSIGFSFFKETDSDFNDVLKRADEALYKSKDSGRNQVNLIL